MPLCVTRTQKEREEQSHPIFFFLFYFLSMHQKRDSLLHSPTTPTGTGRGTQGRPLCRTDKHNLPLSTLPTCHHHEGCHHCLRRKAFCRKVVFLECRYSNSGSSHPSLSYCNPLKLTIPNLFVFLVTDATAKVGNYPFTTIKPNNGIGNWTKRHIVVYPSREAAAVFRIIVINTFSCGLFWISYQQPTFRSTVLANVSTSPTCVPQDMVDA